MSEGSAFDLSNGLPPSKFRPGDKTCAFCNALLVDELSKRGIMDPASEHMYRRCYRSLKHNADKGCLLCYMLWDRHTEMGDSLDDPCCEWTKYGVDAQEISCLEFRVYRWDRNSETDGKLRYVMFHGARKRAGYWDLLFDVHAHLDDPAASEIPDRPIILDVVSDEAFAMANKWLEDCCHEHVECQIGPPSAIPRRLLYVSGSDHLIKLVATMPESLYENAALSYCWGGDQAAKLTRARLSDYERGLHTSGLPRTLQDAIHVTKALQLDYLWIDSLCIVQDDEQEKAGEISQMDAIYQHRHITIMAACASSVKDGFLQVRDEIAMPIAPYFGRTADHFTSLSLDYRCADGSDGRACLSLSMESIAADIGDQISLRAWTFQESLLSRRLLIFDRHQMFWRCRTSLCQTGGKLSWFTCHQAYPILELDDGVAINAQFESTGAIRSHKLYTLGGETWDASIGLPEEPLDSTRRVITEWERLIGLYTQRQLTDLSDILPAISGIAKQVAKKTGLRYTAGLWAEHLVQGLAWRRWIYADTTTNPGAQDDTVVTRWRAPSWSWAAVHGHVSYTKPTERTEVAVAVSVKIRTQPGYDNFGKLRSALLKVKGRLRKVRLDDRGAHGQMHWADASVFPADDEHELIDEAMEPCATALLDDWNPQTRPFHLNHPCKDEVLHALPIFASRRWPNPRGDSTRMHGLILLELEEDLFVRIGWFDSLACDSVGWEQWIREARTFDIC